MEQNQIRIFTVIFLIQCFAYTAFFHFTNRILKMKTLDKLQMQSNKVFWHVILRSYLCNTLCKFLFKIESTWLINSNKQEVVLSHDSKELLVQCIECLIKMKSTWRHGIKEQTPQLTLLYFARTFGSSHWRCSINKPVLKNCKLSTGNSCMGFLFIKVAGLKFYLQLYLKVTAIKVFSCEYYKVNTYFEKHLQMAAFLLFQWFTVRWA